MKDLAETDKPAPPQAWTAIGNIWRGVQHSLEVAEGTYYWCPQP